MKMFVDLVGFSMSLLTLLLIYALCVFPVVPSGLGGGQKPLVNVLLTESDKTDWKSLKVPTKGGQEIGPVRLVREASDAIIISTKHSLLSRRADYTTVYISKKNISEIVFLAADESEQETSPPVAAAEKR